MNPSITSRPLFALVTALLFVIAAQSGCSSSPPSTTVGPDASVEEAGGDDAAVPDAGPEGSPGVLEAGSCAPGTADCDGDPRNGCEARLDDPKHCGACAHDCTGLAHVSGPTTCSAGKCVVPASSCAHGYAHCSSNADDGCEADLSKPATCGGCGTSCSGGTPACASGMCSSGCPSTTPTLCSGSCVDTTSSATNCGRCGNACTAPAHAQATCASNVCGFACNSGYHACGGACADNTSPLTCGTACSPCSAPANGHATCNGTSCDFACNVGYHRCGSTCARDDDATACGASCTVCTVPSGAGHATCSNATCGIACDSGNHLCGTACDSNTSVATCGTSCTPCAAPPSNGHSTCNGTSCGIACDSSYHQCGGSCASNNSIASCGTSCTACATPPNSQPTCNGTSCGFTCNAGYADCDGNASNGCEVNVTNDGNNCNACGHSCLGGACSGSACQPVVLATASSVWTVVIDSNEVYYAYGANAAAVTKNGVAVGSYNTGGNVSAIATDGTSVYIADSVYGYIWKTSNAMTNPRQLFADSSTAPVGIAVTNNNVYFTDQKSRDAIWYVPTLGGQAYEAYAVPPSLLSTLTVGAIAADTLGFAWTEVNPSAGRVMWGNPAFNDWHPMATSQPETTTLVIDSSYMYWGDYTGGDIWRARRDGVGTATRILSGEAGILQMAVDATSIYWTAGARVRKSALDGSGATTIASGGAPAGIAIDSSAIFWADNQNGRVMKLAK